jgi:hypothetical protein
LFICLFVYLFICLNSVFSSALEVIPNHRQYRGFGTHGKEVFKKFHDYYYNKKSLENIKTNYPAFDFEKIIKNDNEKELEICFGWSGRLALVNKFVKTNLVEFIRYSPLYFQSVIEEINEKKQKSHVSKESTEKIDSRGSKNINKNLFFEKYLYHRWLPFIIGSGLFLPGLFSKKEPKVKIPLSLLLAFSGGGAFWMWQQRKLKELKDAKKYEEGNKQEEVIENEIKEKMITISKKEVDEYYKETLITETSHNQYIFYNDVIKKLVMASHEIYNKISEEVRAEKANREKELLLQREKENKAKQADLEHTIITNLNPKNREALNKELYAISKICSDFKTAYNKDLDFKQIEEQYKEKSSLIKSIFELIHITLKQEFYNSNSDMEYDIRIRIPQCNYTLSFNEKNELHILGKSEQTIYDVLLNKTIGSKQDIKKEDNVTNIKSSHDGFYYDGFLKRGGKEGDSTKNLYQLPSIFKEEKELNIENINKFLDLILSYKYD